MEEQTFQGDVEDNWSVFKNIILTTAHCDNERKVDFWKHLERNWWKEITESYKGSLTSWIATETHKNEETDISQEEM